MQIPILRIAVCMSGRCKGRGPLLIYLLFLEYDIYSLLHGEHAGLGRHVVLKLRQGGTHLQLGVRMRHGRNWIVPHKLGLLRIQVLAEHWQLVNIWGMADRFLYLRKLIQTALVEVILCTLLIFWVYRKAISISNVLLAISVIIEVKVKMFSLDLRRLGGGLRVFLVHLQINPSHLSLNILLGVLIT